MGESWTGDTPPKNDGLALATAYGRLNELLGENGQLRQKIEKLEKENGELEGRLFRASRRCEEGLLHRVGYIGFLEDWIGRLLAGEDVRTGILERAAQAEPAGLRPPIAQELIAHGFAKGQAKEAAPTLVGERTHREFSGKQSTIETNHSQSAWRDSP